MGPNYSYAERCMPAAETQPYNPRLRSFFFWGRMFKLWITLVESF